VILLGVSKRMGKRLNKFVSESTRIEKGPADEDGYGIRSD